MWPLSSLSNRIFLACTLLATIPLGFAYYFVNARVSAEADTELLRGLAEAGRLVDQHRATLTDTFTRLAQLLADLPKLKAAVETGDPPTVAPLAEDYRRRSNADVLVVTGRGGRVLGAVGADASVAAAAMAIRRPAETVSTFWRHSRGVLQVVSVPIALAPSEVLGRLTIGFFLDNALAQQFKDLTDSDVAFGAGGRIVASTLPDDAWPALAPLLAGRGVGAVRIGDNDFVVLRRPMTPDTGDNDDTGRPEETPVTLTLRSRTERLRFIDAISTGLGGALLATLLLAILLSYGVARTVTRPLAALTDAMRRIASTGDLTQKVALRSRSWDDEDARLLAATFNTLTETVARNQAEEAQRERLSSLGRLSTVIAHEIRNPLMIIKAAIGSLKRDGAGPEEHREAVVDIEEEATRLNRIVTEVLDFAKPIRFDFAPTDVNAVCAASAIAAAAGDVEPAISLALDPSNPVVVADAERLRTVLVNVLTNARHAVAASVLTQSGVALLPDSPIRVETRRRDDGGVSISIADRGTGIATEDLTHVFEPYFTTRRAGTGLGLPIARNIVIGMGGSIAIASRPGDGTRVDIDLLARPSGSAA